MNIKLRVLVAVAATAALGVMGAVASVPASASAVPASASVATTTGHILSVAVPSWGLPLLNVPGQPIYIDSSPETYKTDCSAGMNYNGEDYCEVLDVNTDLCLQYSHADITVNKKPVANLVIPEDCNSSIVSQDWWWSGQRFRNLYATQIGQDACLNVDTSTNYIDAYLCSGDTSEWSF
jgi:hypothetical protein